MSSIESAFTGILQQEVLDMSIGGDFWKILNLNKTFGNSSMEKWTLRRLLWKQFPWEVFYVKKNFEVASSKGSLWRGILCKEVFLKGILKKPLKFRPFKIMFLSF